MNKEHLLNTPSKRTLFQNALFEHAEQFHWDLEAWAILSNHYHFVAQSPESAESLRPMLQSLHSVTAIALNAMDQTEGRTVWYQFWDTCLTDPKSYFARLHYVHQNPVRHGLVPRAENYSWCSMNWFVMNSGSGLRRKIFSFKIDQVKVPDDF